MKLGTRTSGYKVEVGGKAKWIRTLESLGNQRVDHTYVYFLVLLLVQHLLQTEWFSPGSRHFIEYLTRFNVMKSHDEERRVRGTEKKVRSTPLSFTRDGKIEKCRIRNKSPFNLYSKKFSS